MLHSLNESLASFPPATLRSLDFCSLDSKFKLFEALQMDKVKRIELPDDIHV